MSGPFGLSERQREVIAWRQQGKTLEWIGRRFGVTRERIRQIERKAIDRIALSQGYRLAAATARKLLQERGFLSRRRLLTLLDAAEPGADSGTLLRAGDDLFSTLATEAEATGAIVVLATGWLKEQVEKIAALGARVFLETGSVSVAAIGEKLAEEEKGHRTEILSLLEDCEEEVMGLVSQEIDILRSRAKGLFLARLVLEKAGEPLHWEEISGRVNEYRSHLGLRALSPRTIHNGMGRHSDFSYRDQGTYGLSEWGGDVPFLKDLIVAALKESGKPLALGQILSSVMAQRPVVKSHSIKMYLDLHAEFFESRTGRYGLREWLPERPTIRTARDLVESKRSARRMRPPIVPHHYKR